MYHYQYEESVYMCNNMTIQHLVAKEIKDPIMKLQYTVNICKYVFYL